MIAQGDVAISAPTHPSFVLSTDQRRAVYRADAEVDEQFELYSVAMNDRAVSKLNGALVAGRDVFHHVG